MLGPWEFTMGGYHRSLLWEFTTGVHRGRFNANDLIGCGGDTSPIKCHNNDVIVVVGALTNQNHAWPMGGYHGSSPWEFTIGVYHGRLPREFTMGVYCRRLLWEFTVGVHCGSSPREVQCK